MLYVQNTVANSLVSSLYPDRQTLWESIQDTDGLKSFIYSAVDKYVSLYEANSKGKDKYANLYLAWLDYIRGFTCWTKQTLASLASLALLFGNNSTSLPETKRTIIAATLHAVQEGIQSQMAAHIEQLEAPPSVAELHADDTALYRISGWALKSCIDNARKKLKQKGTDTHVQQQLDLLLSLKRPTCTKDSLPPGVKYLDRGGLTFVQPCLLPWLNAVEASMKLYLCQSGYTKYGKDIFQVRHSLYIL